jgi:hypothetical protein
MLKGAVLKVGRSLGHKAHQHSVNSPYNKVPDPRQDPIYYERQGRVSLSGGCRQRCDGDEDMCAGKTIMRTGSSRCDSGQRASARGRAGPVRVPDKRYCVEAKYARDAYEMIIRGSYERGRGCLIVFGTHGRFVPSVLGIEVRCIRRPFCLASAHAQRRSPPCYCLLSHGNPPRPPRCRRLHETKKNKNV